MCHSSSRLILILSLWACVSARAQDAAGEPAVGSTLLDPSSITVTGHLESSGPTTVELAIRHIQKQIDQQHSDDAARSPLEPFWNSLKYEVVYHQRFATFAEARCAIFNYIETFYNRTRLHSSLAYRSPITFESQLNQQN